MPRFVGGRELGPLSVWNENMRFLSDPELPAGSWELEGNPYNDPLYVPLVVDRGVHYKISVQHAGCIYDLGLETLDPSIWDSKFKCYVRYPYRYSSHKEQPRALRRETRSAAR